MLRTAPVRAGVGPTVARHDDDDMKAYVLISTIKYNIRNCTTTVRRF